MPLITRYATIDDLDQLVPLFDGYRQFYGQEPDLGIAREFLSERFKHQESLIVVAEGPSGDLIGFAQLYPTFSSVRASRTFILNDLFVAPESRRQGVAQALLSKATQVGRALGAVRISLSTAQANEPAQSLYVSQGWKRDDVFLYYTLGL